jgi:hypothetical protein
MGGGQADPGNAFRHGIARVEDADRVPASTRSDSTVPAPISPIDCVKRRRPVAFVEKAWSYRAAVCVNRSCKCRPCVLAPLQANLNVSGHEDVPP